MKDTISELMGEWRIWILIIAVVASIISLSPNPWAKGAVVTGVDEDSPLQGKVSEGTIIKSVDGETVSGPRDLLRYENYTGVLNLQTSEGLKLAQIRNQSLGIETEEASKIDLEFGIDLQGGTRVLLEPQFKNETYNQTQKNRIIAETITTLETRLNVFGLKDMNFQKLSSSSGKEFIQVEAAGVGREMIDELLSSRGEFEAYIPRRVSFDNRTEAVLDIGEENFTFSRSNGSIYYSGRKLDVNDTLTLNDIQFEVWNRTSDSLVVAGKLFSSATDGEEGDIKHVYTTGSGVYIRETREGNYEFSFKVLISEKGAERFAKMTQNLEQSASPTTQICYLSQRLHLFLDEKPVNVLSIRCSTQGQELREPLITGSEKTKEAALEERRRLQSIMRSGRLPVDLKTVKVDTISPRLGQELMESVMIAGVGALIAVAVLIFLIYRTKKIIVPVLITSFSEVLIILGAASMIDWTIDLAAIAGIIAAIGSSVDDQIVITSETMRDDEKSEGKYSVKRRVKRAFFIVFVAAATTIVAMTTLAFIGIGIMRGFAITTIIGVLAGILITRPAYGKIIEKVL